VSENTPSRIIPDSQVIEALELTGRGWVIELDGVIAAFTIGNAITGSLFALFVDPSHQGHGYGRRLHDTVVEWLWSKGLERIWSTHNQVHGPNFSMKSWAGYLAALQTTVSFA
jgi:GNAT superfamily N-acetyltransferase